MKSSTAATLPAPGTPYRLIDGIAVIDAGDRLTFSAGAELMRRVSTLVESGVTHVVLNLEPLAFVDSAGLGALVDVLMQLRKQGGDLRFVNPSERTRHVLSITGIATLIPAFATEALAIASFNAARAAQQATE